MNVESTPRRMDRIYGLQRHIYDFTRPLILPGRDRLLDGIEMPARGRLLEVGCGTARNIARLARRFPEASFVGLDASREMLRTAARRIARRGLSARAALRHGLAQDLAAGLSGDADHRFDAVVLSYTLSMIESPENVLDGALEFVVPGGELHIVDFWSAARWHAFLRCALAAWMDLFGVAHRPAVERWLLARGNAVKEFRVLLGGYAFLARVIRQDSLSSQRTERSSTSKMSVAPGGMTPPAPQLP